MPALPPVPDVTAADTDDWDPDEASEADVELATDALVEDIVLAILVDTTEEAVEEVAVGSAEDAIADSVDDVAVVGATDDAGSVPPVMVNSGLVFPESPNTTGWNINIYRSWTVCK